MGYDVAFFTEAGMTNGMGHLVRSYTIYQYFNKTYKCQFYLDSDINYDYKYKDIKYFKWDNLVLTKQYDIIFVDSYNISIETYNLLNNFCRILVCLDDFSRLIYPKNSVILNIAPDTSKVIQDKNHKYLFGLDYLPIRDILIQNQTNKKDDFILLMLGGNDILNLNQQIISLLDTKQKIVVVDNKKALNINNKNIKILYKTDDKTLASYMARAKIAITTASMNLYELSFLKVATIAIAIKENQQNGLSQFLKYNIATDYIDIKNLDNLTSKIKTLPQSISTPIKADGVKNIERYLKGLL